MPSLADILGDLFLSDEERKRREMETRYGKNRMLPPEEARNLSRESGQDFGGLNPYASANQSQAPQIMRDWEKRIAESQSPTQQQNQPSHLSFLDPQMYQYAGGVAKKVSSAAYDPTEEALSDYYRKTIGKRIVPVQATLDSDILRREAYHFDQLRAEKNQEWDTYDPIARSQIRSMNKMADSLKEAFDQGRLREEEYWYGLSQLKGVAQNYKWGSHKRVPGSQPGDVFEQDGIITLREPDGGVKLVTATPEWQERMKTPILNAKGETVGWNLVDVANGKQVPIKLKEYEEYGANIQAIQARREQDDATSADISRQMASDKELAVKDRRMKFDPVQSLENVIFRRRQADYVNKRISGELPDDAPAPTLLTPNVDKDINDANDYASKQFQNALLDIDQADAEQKAEEAAAAPTTPAPQPTAAGQPKTATDALAVVAADQAYRDERALATTPAQKASVDAKHWRNYPPMIDKIKRAKPVENYKSLTDIPNDTVVELPSGELAYVHSGKAFLLQGANLTELTHPSKKSRNAPTILSGGPVIF